MTSPVRLRMSRSALLPVVLLVVCALPLAFAARWTPVVLLVPAAAAAWVLRVGVDADETGITVRGVLGRQRVEWPDLTGIRIDRRSRLLLATTQREVRLPVLRARDLPRLAALSGGRIPLPDAGSGAERQHTQ